jgi:PAS domain S-box-containing protein
MPTSLSALNPLVLLLDGQGRALRCSQSFRSRAPQPPASVQGTQAPRALFPESDAREIEGAIADGLNAGETTHRSWRSDTASISWTALTIRSPSGIVEFVVVTGVEGEAPTEPVSGRLSHDRLLGSSPFEMWAFDRGTYEFLAVNGAAAREHGYSPDELRSKRVLDLWPWEEAVPLVKALTEMVSGQTTRHRVRHRRKDGTLFDVESEAIAAESAGRPVCLVLSQLTGGLSGLRVS